MIFCGLPEEATIQKKQIIIDTVRCPLTFGFVNMRIVKRFNPSFTGGFFNSRMLDESNCHFKGVGSTLSLVFYFSVSKH